METKKKFVEGTSEATPGTRKLLFLFLSFFLSLSSFFLSFFLSLSSEHGAS